MRKPSTSEHHLACRKKAQACRQQADRQPDRREHWLRQADAWSDRGDNGVEGDGDTATHEVHDGRLIAKPAR